jgi:hypothetical protein
MLAQLPLSTFFAPSPDAPIPISSLRNGFDCWVLTLMVYQHQLHDEPFGDTLGNCKD